MLMFASMESTVPSSAAADGSESPTLWYRKWFYNENSEHNIFLWHSIIITMTAINQFQENINEMPKYNSWYLKEKTETKHYAKFTVMHIRLDQKETPSEMLCFFLPFHVGTSTLENKSKVLHIHIKFKSAYLLTIGARSTIFGWGTMLQAGRSQVQFLMSLDFSIDLTLPAALWPWSQLSL
jgi:hypothetical protein